jgi:hypothetical protein
MMAEENVAGVLEVNPCAQDMDLVTSEAAPAPNSDDNGVDSSLSKRAREEEPEKLDDDEDGVVLNKKQRVEEEEKSLEEERLEKVAGGEDGQVEEEESGRACLGPKTFGSSVEMFDYFYKFLHYWPPNLDVNAVILQFSVCVCLVAEKVDFFYFYFYNAVVGLLGRMRKIELN